MGKLMLGNLPSVPNGTPCFLGRRLHWQRTIRNSDDTPSLFLLYNYTLRSKACLRHLNVDLFLSQYCVVPTDDLHQNVSQSATSCAFLVHEVGVNRLKFGVL